MALEYHHPQAAGERLVRVRQANDPCADDREHKHDEDQDER